MSNNQKQLEAALQGHTPGPWRYEAETQTIRAVPSNYWLATMDSWDGALSNEANARLIAAAPEMLEALQDAVEVVGEWGDDGEPEWVKRAKAIISKATNA